MDEVQRTVLDWGARFLEGGGGSDMGSLRLVVAGERAWRFVSAPSREVREEALTEISSFGVDCTVTVGRIDLVRWGRGELNPQAAFAEGRIRVSGDGLVALRMNGFIGPKE